MSNLFGNMEDFGAKQNSKAPSTNTTPPVTVKKKEEYVMVTLDACWADEFDVCHAWSMTKEDYEEGVKETKK